MEGGNWPDNNVGPRKNVETWTEYCKGWLKDMKTKERAKWRGLEQKLWNENKSFPYGKMENASRSVLFPKFYSQVQTPRTLLVLPFSPLYNYGFRSKTTSSESGHRFTTSETRRLCLSPPCRPRATTYPRFIATAPENIAEQLQRFGNKCTCSPAGKT